MLLVNSSPITMLHIATPTIQIGGTIQISLGNQSHLSTHNLLKAPQQASNLEQAIVNLSKVVGDFVGDQNSINAQLNQRIDSMESTLNKRMDGMQNDLSQKIDNVQYVTSRLTNLNTVQEKGKFPSQPHQNPKGNHEVEAQEGEYSKMRKFKEVITLRSGKEVDQPTSKPKHDEESVAENKRVRKLKEREKGKVQRKMTMILVWMKNPRG
ncbi:hypothetical protein CK203_090227 [Vitis vinifera]|uniref:Uncharacterized protein n=1 Tax=Vitis vinifera TaxID=29760 RepID=A0A438CIX0_VITVI|nr:hypothetical protein CK203_090227 [Vitis vinifera]